MTEETQIIMTTPQGLTDLLKTAQETGQSIEKLVEDFEKITLDSLETPLVQLPNKLRELKKVEMHIGNRYVEVIEWEDIEQLLEEVKNG